MFQLITIKPFIFFICATLLIGCANELNNSIEKAASDDIISPEECSAFESIILNDKPAYKNLLDGESVKSEALLNRIRWIVKKPIQIECREEKPVEVVKPKYEVYLENSGSMDGYVKGNTAFKNTLHTFLNNIQLPTNSLTEDMKFFYINSEKIPSNGSLQDFVLNLNSKTFRDRGGNRMTTDFAVLFDTLLKTWTADKVLLFISDCVLSPERGKSSDDFLVAHRESVKTTFNQHLSRNRDFKTVVLKLNSQFTGTYFDFKNHNYRLNKADRPYYIWIFGNSEHVDQLFSKIKIPDEAEKYLVFSCSEKILAHQVLMSPKIGDYSKDGQNKLKLVRAEKATGGKNDGMFGFPVSIDMRGYYFDPSHLLSPENYELMPPSYSVAIETIPAIKKAAQSHLNSYSHILTLTTDILRKEQVSVQLKRNLPDWVGQSNSNDDNIQTGGELHKTYGLLYLLTGVSEAYKSAANDPDAYFTLTFQIEK